MLYLINWGSAAVNSWEEGKENETGKAGCRIVLRRTLRAGISSQESVALCGKICQSNELSHHLKIGS